MLRNYSILLLAFAVLADGYLVYREDLRLNKTPKVPSIFSNACDECQVVIRRLADVAQDPGKMAELKAILLVLCDETTYKEECRMFVNRIDLFLDRLLPYLRNPHEVCHKLHICGNSKLQTYHHIGMYFAQKYITDKAVAASTLICDECHFAVDELLTYFNDHKKQEQVKEFLSKEVCAHLGRIQGTCDMLVEDFLPDFWIQVREILKNDKKLCVDLRMCKSDKNIFTASIKSSGVAQDEDDQADESGNFDGMSEDEARKSALTAKVSKNLVAVLLN